ncbi:MAG: amidohydrolase family protein [Paracoccaceae bacterium]
MRRRLSGAPPRTRLPAGAVDTQMHAYLPGFPARPGGPPNPPEPLPTPAMYREVMTWLGIDRVVVTQGNAQQFDNANLLACLAEFGDVARGVAVITGETDDAEMARLAGAGVVGARVMDLPGGAVGLDRIGEIDARAAAFGWMMAVQLDGGRLPEHESRLARLRSRWVLDHHAKIFAGATPDGPEVAAIRRLIDRGNVWFKFAGVYESSRAGPPGYEDVAAVSRAIAAHVPERIVWGTNWPHNLARTEADYPDDAALLDTVLGWLADEAARRRALVDNPAELFAFPPAAHGGAA